MIGGMWNPLASCNRLLEISRMRPEHSLLDLGCGSGRLAVKAVPYLNSRNYFGIDISPSLIEAARTELANLGYGDDRIDETTFHATDDFIPSNKMPSFDFIIAQSLFTHLPLLDYFGKALHNPHATLPCKFYATFSWHQRTLRDCGTGLAESSPTKIETRFISSAEEILNEARGRNWSARCVGEWGHPRDQQMFEFEPAR
ncbi:MAG: class I SAM-dependent methyltransferase [Caulobacteraceae bacterium]|nr:class I SAM-dependent methyltransferase [Caulobacteraceae bacterium]